MWRNPTIAASVLALLSVCFSATAAGEEMRLRPLKPAVTALLESERLDLSEMAYVTARGAALYTALSSYIDSNPRGDEDKKLAHALLVLASKYYQVALVTGLRAKKEPKWTEAQVKLLMETYTAMAIKSKQLNNEVLSPEIMADMDALKQIQPVILEFSKDIEAQAKSDGGEAAK